jgi:phosphatidylserine/phosphatidylglycerophosphate/cardiolipin synthase-like enzyme
MRCRFLLLVLVLVGLVAGTAYGGISVFFSPHGGCDQAIILLARSAQMYLDAACYTFSLDSVADELIPAKKRGVTVRVVVDQRQAGQTWSPVGRLASAGIPVEVNTHGGLSCSP